MSAQRWRQSFLRTPLGDVHILIALVAFVMMIIGAMEHKYDVATQWIAVFVLAYIANRAVVYLSRNYWLITMDTDGGFCPIEKYPV